MKTFQEDKELRALIKSIQLDSPEKDFSKRVMNRIFEEQPALEQVKAERIFSKSFWIILGLFVALIAAMVIFSATGANGGGEIEKLLPDLSSTAVSQEYNNIFDKITGLPASIAGIMFAASLLLFLERFLSAKSSKIGL